jgi:hypothetical protein
MVVVILEDIERRRDFLRIQGGKFITGNELEKFVHLMNWAEYHLRQLEMDTQKPS